MNSHPDKHGNPLRRFPSDLLAVIGLPVVITMVALGWITSVHGEAWLWAVAISFAIAVCGAVLLFMAKLPLYRQGQFCTFGIETIPEPLRGFYRWGCRCAIAGCVMLLLLLIGSVSWR